MLIQVILIGLAGWRLANMAVDEAGPFDLFERIRILIGLKPGEISGFLPNLFSCLFCMSVWTTVISYGLWQIEPIIVMVIAAMSIALICDKAANR